MAFDTDNELHTASTALPVPPPEAIGDTVAAIPESLLQRLRVRLALAGEG